ncbi:MAG: hypothetical protein ACM3PT_02765 [Deltaproteobacteria bacterium]
MIITDNGSGSITTLAPLNGLTSVVGTLYIYSNSALTSFDFPILNSVGGDLYIYGNSALTSFDFPNLNSVGNNLDISYNSVLENLDGLEAIASVGEDVYLQDNVLLAQCCGLYPLINAEVNGGGTAIGGSIYISGNLTGCNDENEIITGGPCGLIYNSDKMKYYMTLQEAIDDADPNQTIVLFDDLTESDITVTNSVIIEANGFSLNITGTLSIPAGKSLTWQENNLILPSGAVIDNDGTLINNGTIIYAGTFTNTGTYKGSGNFIGTFVNEGIVNPGE